jgi:xanthine/CO dehydrogenase XdhC/CoxF family maturation factor
VTEISQILQLLQMHPGQPAVLATLVHVAGSSYRRPGARLLLLPDGTRVGSISGGCLEEDVLARARRVLASGASEIAVYDTTSENDLVWGVGLGCQGVVQIVLERIEVARPAWVAALATNLRQRRATDLAVGWGKTRPSGTRLAVTAADRGDEPDFRETIAAPPALVICGAGDDAQPLVRLAKELGWHVSVSDTRAAYATPERFPGADRVMAAPVPECCRGFADDDRTFVVVMTHRYADDREYLRELLPRALPYLGQLGPRKRTDRLLEELARTGTTMEPAYLAKLHAPVGLDLGGGTPETVALAIVAEIQARLAGHAGGSLRDRPGPIHG